MYKKVHGVSPLSPLSPEGACESPHPLCQELPLPDYPSSAMNLSNYSSLWYTANFQYLLTQVDRVLQVLAQHINCQQNQSIPPKFEQKLASKTADAVLNLPSALEQLCAIFGLSPFERDILLLCVGSELDPRGVQSLCAAAQGDENQNYPTLELALNTLHQSHWSILSSQSPLQYWKLIEIGQGQTLTQSPLRIDQRILCFLLGEPCLDDKLVGIVKLIHTSAEYNTLLPPSHQVLVDNIVATCFQAAELDDLAQRIDSNATWNDLVLPEQQQQTLLEIVTHVEHRDKVYWKWGFAGKGSRGLGISVLFEGPPGTGKTTAAEVLAKELRLDLYRIDLSQVENKYIGETEKNLRRIFDAAEAGGVVLLFDEADAIFGKRTEVKDSHDRHANVKVSYLLQRMEAYQGLAILTTNMKSSLDQAFLRRLRFVVSFPFPDFKLRVQIWRHSFSKDTPTQGLEFDKLAQLNLAGGNIRNIALNASFIAAAAGEAVMMKHVLSAAQSECIKWGKTLTGTEVKGWV